MEEQIESLLKITKESLQVIKEKNKDDLETRIVRTYELSNTYPLTIKKNETPIMWDISNYAKFKAINEFQPVLVPPETWLDLLAYYDNLMKVYDRAKELMGDKLFNPPYVEKIARNIHDNLIEIGSLVIKFQQEEDDMARKNEQYNTLKQEIAKMNEEYESISANSLIIMSKILAATEAFSGGLRPMRMHRK